MSLLPEIRKLDAPPEVAATYAAPRPRPRLAPGAGVPGGHGPAVLTAIGHFTGQVIAR